MAQRRFGCFGSLNCQTLHLAKRWVKLKKTYPMRYLLIIISAIFFFISASVYGQVETDSIEEISLIEESVQDTIDKTKGVNYEKLSCGFYKNATGNLFIKTTAIRNEVEIVFKPIPQIDINTYEELDSWYSKDNRNIYFSQPTSDGINMFPIDSANVGSFEVILNTLYAKDNEHVYYWGRKIKGCDSKKLKLFIVNNNLEYIGDDKHIFQGDLLIYEGNTNGFMVSDREGIDIEKEGIKIFNGKLIE